MNDIGRKYTIGVHWAYNYVQTVWQDCGKLFQLHPNGINGEIFNHDSFPHRKHCIVRYFRQPFSHIDVKGGKGKL